MVLAGADSNVSLELTDVPWQEALEIAAEAAGCVVEERTGGILVVLKPERVTYETKGTDITEIRELQDKLASVGLLIGTISHGIKGLLNSLDGGIYLINSGQKKDDQVHANLKTEKKNDRKGFKLF